MIHSLFVSVDFVDAHYTVENDGSQGRRVLIRRADANVRADTFDITGVQKPDVLDSSGQPPSFKHLMPPGALRRNPEPSRVKLIVITVNRVLTNVQKMSKSLRCPLWTNTMYIYPQTRKCYLE